MPKFGSEGGTRSVVVMVGRGHVTITTSLCVVRDSSTDVHLPDIVRKCMGGEALRCDIF